MVSWNSSWGRNSSWRLWPRNSGVKRKAEDPALGAVQVQAQHIEGPPLGLPGNQIPFLGGKWSLNWHPLGWGVGKSLGN